MRANSASSFGSASSFRLDDDGTRSPPPEPEGLPDYKIHLTKYGKSFSTKLIQILVQSRTTDRFPHNCTDYVDGQVHWFNLQLDELGEVTAFMKSLKIEKFPPAAPQLSIDFFLYTCDHETLPLETWTFHVDENDRKDLPSLSPKEHQSIFYHQLSTLLRSAMVAARMTPLHRYYVKKQSAESFVILYRITNGPSTIDIGKEAKRFRVGSLPTYLGSWKLDVAYRTRMEIEPSSSHVLDGTESFQRIGSPGSTPDSFKMQIGSPSSFGGISHFSTSPSMSSPTDFSPLHDNFIQSRIQSSCTAIKPARSRSTSLVSDLEDVAVGSPKEVYHSVSLPKGMPFANLLVLSYSGALFPLIEGNSEHDDDNSTVLNVSNTTVMAQSSRADNELENSIEERSRKNTIIEIKRPKDLYLKNCHKPKMEEDDEEDTCVTPRPSCKSDDDLTPQEEVSLSPLGISEDKAVPVNSGSNLTDMSMSTPKNGSPLKGISPMLCQDVIFKMGSSSCMKTSEDSEELSNVLAGASKVKAEINSDSCEKRDNAADVSSSSNRDDTLDGDGSFVKIPAFQNAQNQSDEGNELAALLSHCKEAPILSSFSTIDITKINEELEALSLKQGLFDQFISEIREAALEEEY